MRVKMILAIVVFTFTLIAFGANAQQGDESPALFPVNDASKTIYIDRTGKVILTTPYAGGRFSEGLAPVNVNGKTGYIDRTGKLVIQPLPYTGLNFSEGLAVVLVPSKCLKASDKQYYGFIDHSGKLVILTQLTHPCNYYGEQFDFKDGLALTQIGDKWGFIDRSGKVVMQFDEAQAFSEGLASVKIGGKFGYINRKGKIVIAPQFDVAFPFSEGLAAVKVNNLFGFIDRKGRMLIQPRFTEVRSFSEGLAAYTMGESEGYRWGYIDHTGKVVIAPQKDNYAYGYSFKNGLVRISIDREEGYMDKSGKVTIEPQFSWASDFSGGLAFVSGEDIGRAYIDTSGKVVYKFPEPPAPPPDPRNPFVKINASTDVAWLEGIASSPFAASELKPGGGLANHAKDLSTAAYARLGVIGTTQSIAAIKRIEERARRTSLTPKYIPLNISTHPGWHFSDSQIKPLAQTVSSDGTTYAIIIDFILGDLDLFLTSSKTPEDDSSWTRPVLIPRRVYRGIRDATLSMKGSDELTFSFTQEKPPGRALMEGTFDPGPQSPAIGKQEWKLSIKEIERDSDGDGWTDAEEERLGLDPHKKDSDGDGLPDGEDVCPNYAPPPSDLNDEDAMILQRAIFATFGLSGSRYLLLVGEKSRRLQLWGLSGPVIYGQTVQSWSKRHQYGAVYVDWRIRKRLPNNEVIVEIVDYEGPLAAGGQDVRLRKIGNEWFVISRRTTWVS
jgi:hypothetical protein